MPDDEYNDNDNGGIGGFDSHALGILEDEEFMQEYDEAAYEQWRRRLSLDPMQKDVVIDEVFHDAGRK